MDAEGHYGVLGAIEAPAFCADHWNDTRTHSNLIAKGWSLPCGILDTNKVNKVKGDIWDIFYVWQTTQSCNVFTMICRALSRQEILNNNSVVCLSSVNCTKFWSVCCDWKRSFISFLHFFYIFEDESRAHLYIFLFKWFYFKIINY